MQSMSYDLAVWYAAKPITTQQAAEIYEQMVDNDEILALHADRCA